VAKTESNKDKLGGPKTSLLVISVT
jgi:hypothetical protein